MAPSGLYARLCHAFLVKIIATECQILTLKCTKLYVGWGSVTDVAGELIARPDSHSGFKGACF